MENRRPDSKELTLTLFAAGADEWNTFRKSYPSEPLILSGIDFERMDLSQFDLHDVQIISCDMSGVKLRHANLEGARLAYVVLDEADLYDAHFDNAFFWNVRAKRANCEAAIFAHATFYDTALNECNLTDAVFFTAACSDSDFTGSDFTGAWFGRTSLVNTKLDETVLVNCNIHGCSVWDVSLNGAIQRDLVVTEGDPRVTVDNIEVGQFVYLLLNNQKIRGAIDSLASRFILILGCFSPERKETLNELRAELRKHNLAPVLFDFDKPPSRDLTETVSALALLSRFVIADLTDPRSVPHELASIIPHLRSVPIQPIILKGQNEYGMIRDLAVNNNMMPIFRYRDNAHLIASVKTKIITNAERRVEKIRRQRRT
jgi:uncharacterized protein YjbI with pentapeptide repeats